MIICDAKPRKWGNSLGITIPKEIVEEYHLKENRDFKIALILPQGIVKRTFGLTKGKLKKSSQELKDEIKRDLYEK